MVGKSVSTQDIALDGAGGAVEELDGPEGCMIVLGGSSKAQAKLA